MSNDAATDRSSCKVSQQKIFAATERTSEEDIIVKIRGSNSNCSGPWSDPPIRRMRMRSGADSSSFRLASCPSVMVAPYFDDKEAQIRKDSITINWTQLEGAAAGGEGYEIDEYEITYKLLKEVDGELVLSDDVSRNSTPGHLLVDGDVREWKHTSLNNAESW